MPSACTRTTAHTHSYTQIRRLLRIRGCYASSLAAIGVHTSVVDRAIAAYAWEEEDNSCLRKAASYPCPPPSHPHTHRRPGPARPHRDSANHMHAHHFRHVRDRLLCSHSAVDVSSCPDTSRGSTRCCTRSPPRMGHATALRRLRQLSGHHCWSSRIPSRADCRPKSRQMGRPLISSVGASCLSTIRLAMTQRPTLAAVTRGLCRPQRYV